MKKFLIQTVLISLAGTIFTLQASQDVSKRTLKTNYREVYNKLPSSVDSIGEMFTEGMAYGRVRSHTFYYEWEEESAKQNSHLISGLGGSAIYKSAAFAGIDFTGGYYFSRAFFDDGENPVARLKSGKDTLSRFDYGKSKNRTMSVLAQAYLRYRGIKETELRVGRQPVESFYAKTNDSKMIPNTFEGAVVKSKPLPSTSFQLGCLTAQKLRDHTTFHSVLAYGDANTTSGDNPQWSLNDDSAMHKGLTYTRLKQAGISTEAPLILGDIHNSAIDGLKLDAAFYSVPELLSEVMLEANYKVVTGALSWTPGIRYIRQVDDGAGKIGGAAYNGTLAGKSGKNGGYESADSLDSQMIAARFVGKYENYAVNIGYTHVFDEADLVTPWRAFPTAGYTRSMARYNWTANTSSYRVVLKRNANKTGVYRDLYTEISALYTDADETKGYFDEHYYYAGFVQNVPALPELSWRLRLGYNDTEKKEADSLDGRFELNYLF